MHIAIKFLTAVPATLLFASCGTKEPAPSGETETEAVDAAIPTTGEKAAIPVALQGRWGLVPADCTSTRGDAKGLIEVSTDSVKFFESVGTLGEVSQSDASNIRATYGFTGEGMSWVRDMALSLSDDGDKLVREEFGEDAMAAPLTYSKCS